MFRILLFSLTLLFSPLVLSLQYCPSVFSSSSTTPSFQFTISEETVTDKITGLIWQRCSLGLSGSDCNTGKVQKFDWQDALQIAEDYRNSTGISWRLPNIKELQSIIEFSCNTPAINTDIFPSTNLSLYWSATNDANSGEMAWAVSFDTGVTVKYLKTYNLPVRLVRSE